MLKLNTEYSGRALHIYAWTARALYHETMTRENITTLYMKPMLPGILVARALVLRTRVQTGMTHGTYKERFLQRNILELYVNI